MEGSSKSPPLKAARRILVTGASGFIGSHLARSLAESGHVVTATGRNRYAAPRLLHQNIQFAQADIRDRSAVAELCQGQDLVYHVAALTSDWASRRLFQDVNVGGTQNVVDACLACPVNRLVHVSSSAVFFEFRDKLDLPDDAEYAKRPCCTYGATKIEAERIVQRAVGAGLDAVIVRARAVFGPGDNSLLPRLVEAARVGRLRQIGDGRNRLDLTYIDNLIHALVLAADRGGAGMACTITNGEPIRLWDALPEILSDLGVAMRPGKIPRRLAHLAATLSELRGTVLPGSGEPSLTRYRVGLVSTSQTFSQETARRELGYEPPIPLGEGIRRTVASMTTRDDCHSPVHVPLGLFTTGYLVFSEHLLFGGGERKKVRIPILFASLHHPRHGVTLFDTGYTERFITATRRFPYRFYRWATPVRSCPELSAANVLERQNVRPQDVRRIIISHFHADHIAGLRDFPNADLIVRDIAWEDARSRSGIGAVRQAVLPDLLPRAKENRLHPIRGFHDPGMGPFDHSHDLFADGSVRLFELEGHAAGQIGALVQTGADQRKFLVADAVYHSEAFRRGTPFHPVTRLFVSSYRRATCTAGKLHEFHKQYPDIEILPTHCPEVGRRYDCEGQYSRVGLK